MSARIMTVCLLGAFVMSLAVAGDWAAQTNGNAGQALTGPAKVVLDSVPASLWLSTPMFVEVASSGTITIPAGSQSVVSVDARVGANMYLVQDGTATLVVELRIIEPPGLERVLDTVKQTVTAPSNVGIDWAAQASVSVGHAMVLEPGTYSFVLHATVDDEWGCGGSETESGWLRVLIIDQGVEGDFDIDGDVDLADFGRFQDVFMGPNP